ncbi:R-spondin-3 [Denticeps clupeoides]|uniref:R-spondin Fu-CRD domain-containing protein n=1 Tax=Denticeps clupeoides TaxID=299321 RepID=A0AAY4E8R8_9TELE|nr:R-spondin-3 [Denticeps clupeoides]
MHLQLVSFVLILHCTKYTHSHKHTPGMSTGCQSGCLTCSDYNGCLSCKPKFFIFLERNGMKQTGVCLTSCPSGYYGTRSPERNDCTKCRPECDSCFTGNFCTRCRAGFYLHQGKCLQSCPEGRAPNDAQRECVPECPAECDSCTNSDTCTRCAPGHYLLLGKCHHDCPEEYEPSEPLMMCIPPVHCEVGGWSEWSPCAKPGKACSVKRTREVIQSPSPHGKPCPVTFEKRGRVPGKKNCKDRRNRNNRKEKENQDIRRDRKRDRKACERENPENRNKTERRRRRGQGRSAGTAEGDAVQ